MGFEESRALSLVCLRSQCSLSRLYTSISTLDPFCVSGQSQSFATVNLIRYNRDTARVIARAWHLNW